MSLGDAGIVPTNGSCIPAAKSAISSAMAIRPISRRSFRMPRRTPTVFVVDDDPNVCRSLRFLMRSAGLEVKLFLTAEEFLQTFEVTSTGCLLLDLHLPGTGVLEIQQKLLQIRCTIPIIFMTGRGDIAVAVQCLNRGAFDFFQKPINPRVLLARVREAINSGSRCQQREAAEAGSPERNVAPETWSNTNSVDAVARHEKYSGRDVPVV